MLDRSSKLFAQHRFSLVSLMRLSASRLSVERGGRIVFSGLSFAIEAGQSLIVTGRNGAGKSTLLRALAGLLPLAQGELSLAPASDESLAEQMHFIGHADALKGALTVAENLSFYAALLRSDRGGAAPGAGARSVRPRSHRAFAGRLSLGGPETARRPCAAPRRAEADLAARRALDGARRRLPGPCDANHARACVGRRRHHRRDPRGARPAGG